MKRQLIEKIRDDYSLTKNTERTLVGYNRSIKKLADDLYEKDSHFIFELIQNAEDNEYKKVPVLRFELSQRNIEGTHCVALVVHNNEIGFNEKNVVAICTVDGSTKNKAQGYIGEKGIGFKSVFRITACPYVFSNGFQFCLPEQDAETGLGFIVPRWLVDMPDGVSADETTIILPIKNPKDVQTVVGALRDIAPETILFLKKLSAIKISINLPENDSRYDVFIDKRVPPKIRTSKLVELSYERRGAAFDKTLDTFRYWVTEIEFDKPAHVQHEKRRDIKSRPVSVAIPLDHETHGGKLFAYLPVWEETGLPFLINADFLLVSSREGIHKDEEWNHWLRDCIVETYAKSIAALLNAHKIALKTKILAYSSIPLESHQTFLKPIIEQIQALLADMNCVLALPDKALVKPSQARLCNDKLRKLLTDADHPLPLLLRGKIRLVCPEIEAFSRQLRAISVKQIEKKELILCLEDTAWVRRHRLPWFINLFQYLSNYCTDAAEFRAIPIVPVGTEGKKIRLACDKEQPIYFPIEEIVQKALAHVPAWLTERVPIAFLDKELASTIDKQEDKEALKKWLTDTLAVYPFSMGNYCVAILSKLKDEYEKLNCDQLVAVADFLAQHADDNFNWDDLPVILTDGRRILLGNAKKTTERQPTVISDGTERIACREMQAVVVPENYDPSTGWQHIWQTEEDRRHFVALADSYSKEFCKLLVRKRKITRYPGFEKRTYPYYSHKDLETTEAQLLDQCFKRAARSRSSETKLFSFGRPSFMANGDEDVSENTSLALLAFINSLTLPEQGAWNYNDKVHECGFKAKCTYDHYGSHSEFEDSAVFLALKNLAWLPSTKGPIRPSRAFQPRESIKEIMDDTVPYFEKDLSAQISNLLGIRTELTVDQILAVLKDDSGNPGINSEKVQRLYSALESQSRYSVSSVKKAFADAALIFISTGTGEGTWHKTDECVWVDSSNVLGHDFVYLEKHYPKLKDFFVERVGVKENVDTECFARRWLKLQVAPMGDKEQQRKIVERLYGEIKSVAEQPAAERPDWWAGFAEKALLYTQSDAFVPPDKIVIPDDGELQGIFQDCCEFTWRPDNDSFSYWQSFFKAFDVPLLSESVTGDLEQVVDPVYRPENQFVTTPAVQMIASWLREKRRDDYNRLFQNGVFDKLLALKEATTAGEITVEFQLGYKWKTVTYPVFWDKHNILIYQNEPDKYQLAKTLARGLAVDDKDNLDTWIEVVLGATNTKKLKDKNWEVPPEILALCSQGVATLPASLDIAASESSETEEAQGTQHPVETSGIEQQGGMDSEGSTAQTIDFVDGLENAFNKKGVSKFGEEHAEWLEHSTDGQVKDPGRRGGKLESQYVENIQNEPSPEERRKETVRAMLEEPNESVRKSLYEWYGGKCQVCGETWPKRDGNPFFVTAYLNERQRGRWLDEPGNAICLCAEHFAQWRHAAIETPDVKEQIRSLRLKAEGGDGNLSIHFKVLGKDCTMTFDERHLLALRKFLEVAGQT